MIGRVIAAIWKGFLDLLRLIGDRPLLMFVIIVFGGSAIWGQEYIGELVNMIAEAIQKMKQL